MTVSPAELVRLICSTPAILKSIWSSVSAVIDVSWSASNNNSTPFKSTATVKSANLAEVIVASVIPVVPDIVDSAMFYLFISFNTIYKFIPEQLLLQLKMHL